MIARARRAREQQRPEAGATQVHGQRWPSEKCRSRSRRRRRGVPFEIGHDNADRAARPARCRRRSQSAQSSDCLVAADLPSASASERRSSGGTSAAPRARSAVRHIANSADGSRSPACRASSPRAPHAHRLVGEPRDQLATRDTRRRAREKPERADEPGPPVSSSGTTIRAAPRRGSSGTTGASSRVEAGLRASCADLAELASAVAAAPQSDRLRQRQLDHDAHLRVRRELASRAVREIEVGRARHARLLLALLRRFLRGLLAGFFAASSRSCRPFAGFAGFFAGSWPLRGLLGGFFAGLAGFFAGSCWLLRRRLRWRRSLVVVLVTGNIAGVIIVGILTTAPEPWPASSSTRPRSRGLRCRRPRQQLGCIARVGDSASASASSEGRRVSVVLIIGSRLAATFAAPWELGLVRSRSRAVLVRSSNCETAFQIASRDDSTEKPAWRCAADGVELFLGREIAR